MDHFKPALFYVLGLLCRSVHHTHTPPWTVVLWGLFITILENLHSMCVFPRSDLVEKNAMLRTKAMREKEEQRERRKYNYTLLRIRLPDGNLLQGKILFLKSIQNSTQ